MSTISCASDVGTDLNVVGNSDGGSSWIISICANVNQTAVNWRCDARQTISSSGPGCSERIVTSVGRHVIAFSSSLTACDRCCQSRIERNTRILSLEATHVTDAGVCAPQLDRLPYRVQDAVA